MAKGRKRNSDIVKSTASYESWLRRKLKNGDGSGELVVVASDLDEKHEKMCKDAFTFLRATYWRWAETIDGICGKKFAEAPNVLAVGDIHLENYGVWRDKEGRLVWGVNDFDEAAKMPYVYDLVRLAVSAALAPILWRTDADNICFLVLEGYKNGLEEPRPFVLDRDQSWLRQQFEVDQAERAVFWSKIDERREKARKKHKGKNPPIPEAFRKALKGAIPGKSKVVEYFASDAGTGSLGRPRWVAYRTWRGAPVIREAKAVVPSAWTRCHPNDSKIRCEEIAKGDFRAPDPHYQLDGDIVIRRLSPNSRKLEVDKHGLILIDPRMLRMMAFDLANVHLGTVDKEKNLAASIEDHLSSIASAGFSGAVRNAEQFVRGEHREWSAQSRKFSPELHR